MNPSFTNNQTNSVTLKQKPRPTTTNLTMKPDVCSQEQKEMEDEYKGQCDANLDSKECNLFLLKKDSRVRHALFLT